MIIHCFSNVNIKKMENNRTSAVIVAHFIMKKEAIRHIFVISDTEVMKLFTQSEGHIGNSNHKIFMVVMATKLEQNEFN